MASPQRFGGSDVAAETVTVSWTEDRQTYAPAQTVAQDPEGFARLLHLFEQSGGIPEATLVVMEAPDPWSPPPQVYHALRQRLVAREGLLTMRQQARNHLHALKRWTVVSNVQERWDTVMDDLDAPITSLDREIAALLRDSAWAESATLLLFIPGGGIQTTAWLLVAMLNFTTCETADSLPAYGGMTPHSMNRGVACGNGHE